jgi:hypothetical protein
MASGGGASTGAGAGQKSQAELLNNLMNFFEQNKDTLAAAGPGGAGPGGGPAN